VSWTLRHPDGGAAVRSTIPSLTPTYDLPLDPSKISLFVNGQRAVTAPGLEVMADIPDLE